MPTGSLCRLAVRDLRLLAYPEAHALIVGALAPSTKARVVVCLALNGAAEGRYLVDAGLEVVNSEEDLKPGLRVVIVESDGQGWRVHLPWT